MLAVRAFFMALIAWHALRLQKMTSSPVKLGLAALAVGAVTALSWTKRLAKKSMCASGLFSTCTGEVKNTKKTVAVSKGAFPGVRGLCAAAFTPFKPDGTVNLDIIDKYAAHLVADGVHNVFINGTTGE